MGNAYRILNVNSSVGKSRERLLLAAYSVYFILHISNLKHELQAISHH